MSIFMWQLQRIHVKSGPVICARISFVASDLVPHHFRSVLIHPGIGLHCIAPCSPVPGLSRDDSSRLPFESCVGGVSFLFVSGYI